MVAKGSCVWQAPIVTLFPAPPHAGVAFGSVLACDLPGQGAVQTQETATFCTAGVLRVGRGGPRLGHQVRWVCTVSCGRGKASPHPRRKRREIFCWALGE